MSFNSSLKFFPNKSIDTVQLGIVLPHSSKVLSEFDIDAKIKKTQSHIDHLSKALSHRNTHGGKRFRRRQISLRDQIDTASKELALLSSAKDNVNKTLLKPFLESHIVLTCSKKTLKSTIEKVASFVSNTWAQFPQMIAEKREILRKNGIWLMRIDEDELFSKEVCDQFEATLKERIITDLNKEKTRDCENYLYTSYRSCDILDDIAEQFFLKNRTMVGELFPYKSYTDIELTDNKKKLHLRMNFKSPYVP